MDLHLFSKIFPVLVGVSESGFRRPNLQRMVCRSTVESRLIKKLKLNFHYKFGINFHEFMGVVSVYEITKVYFDREIISLG